MSSFDGDQRLPRPSALDAGRRALAARHVDWALRFARDFYRRFPPQREDLRSAALLGLCEAAGSFDVARGVKFTSFARRRIVGSMQEYLRQSRLAGYRWCPALDADSDPRVISLSEVLAAPEYADNPPDGLIDPASPTGWEAESVDAVEALARTLPGRHGVVILLLYTRAEHDSKADVARALGIHRTRISQLHGEAIGMLRLSLEGRR